MGYEKCSRRKMNVLEMKCFEKFGWSVTIG